VIAAHAGTILVIIGAVTASAIALVFAPAFGSQFAFHEEAPDVVVTALLRHWGLLIALVGGLLIYAGYHAEVRTPVLIVAAVEKVAVGLIFGTALPRNAALMLIVGADGVMALLCLILLFGGVF
jgi:hypothetical protein